MRYEFLDTPCMNKAYVCTHSQFSKEFKSLYPEIDYSIPKEVLQIFGNPSKASENCLVVLMNPVMKIQDAAWLCHMDLKVVLELQSNLSKMIFDANQKSFDFVADYISGKNTVTKGVMTLNKDKFLFNDMNKKLILTAEWKDVEPYATALYLKEEIEWKGTGEKPDSQRCIKFFRKSELDNMNPDYFCAYYQRNDITRKFLLQLPQGRFAAELYANKINIRIQDITVKNNLLELAKMNKSSLEVDAKLLFPLKIQVRKFYFLKRHDLVNQVKLGQLKKSELKLKLEENKTWAIEKVCGGIELCKKALRFCVDKEMLPLKGVREKFAWDPQNPYHRLMPKTNIKIDLPKEGSLGQAIMSAVAKMKGAGDYFAEKASSKEKGGVNDIKNLLGEKIPESAAGEIPNVTSIRKAFNTVLSLREKKEYKSFLDSASSCKSNIRNSSNDIRRKISFLQFAGDNDVFFEYLGFIRDFQLTKKKS
jgi:hypothetical protein